MFFLPKTNEMCLYLSLFATIQIAPYFFRTAVINTCKVQANIISLMYILMYIKIN